MVMEQHRPEPMEQIPLRKHGVSSEKWKSISSSGDEAENNPSGGFDCNICLDLVQDPVVTFCGHLYCWPCIYKWIHSQSSCTEDVTDRHHPQCPVCKAELSEKTLIPLYGRGLTTEGKAGGNLGIVIPQRPPSPRCGGHLLIANAASNDQHRGYPQRAPPYQPYPGSYYNAGPMPSPTNVLNHPMMGMIGEMVYARMSRNPEMNLYAYPNSYHVAAAGGNSPRMRRQMLQADRSLGRVCFFLCCCVVLCLLLF